MLSAFLRRKQVRQAIFAHWYRHTSPLPPHWSTDWGRWALVFFWIDCAADGWLKIDKLFKEMWNVPGRIEPLAYIPIAPGEYFLLRARGQYYWYADGRLTVHEASMAFGDTKEFVEYIARAEDASRLPNLEVPQEPGTDLMWWTVICVLVFGMLASEQSPYTRFIFESITFGGYKKGINLKLKVEPTTVIHDVEMKEFSDHVDSCLRGLLATPSLFPTSGKHPVATVTEVYRGDGRAVGL
ncbi:hypothetical protein C8R45DRAFT_948123 [Mycena sanguinolenta]|nr:hypothetical protein C8R45DRAFT_948123 [Mycena sanguinolenta]